MKRLWPAALEFSEGKSRWGGTTTTVLLRNKRMRMTKEMYESLQVKDLKSIAEDRGMNVPARTRKEKLVEMLLELDQAEDEKVLAERRRLAEAAANESTGIAEGTGNDAPAVLEKSTQEEARAQQKRRKGSRRRPDASDETEHSQNETAESGKSDTSDAPDQERNHYAAPQPGQTGRVRETAGRMTGNAVPRTTVRRQSGKEAGTERGYEAGREPIPAREAGLTSAAVAANYARRGLSRPDQQIVHKNDINPELDSGEKAKGILEVMSEGYGFIRSANYMPGDGDVYVAPSQIRRFNLKTGDIVEGGLRVRNQNEKFSALLYVTAVNGLNPEESKKRYNFEDMTPIFPDDRIRLEKPGASIAMRVMDLMCPVGKGQRGMIVSPPKAGKTTLMKEVAKSIKANNPDIHLIILLIDERPEEVTDLREALEGPNAEVIYSTFDELPEHHKRVAEMTIERAKRLVEAKKDVVILLDSITRLTRAYNLTEPSSGRTLSGGLDPVALHMPKRFFGAARNMREGGSLTILATALIETGSKMDDVVYEEFKGTGNMEMILNRKLSERRIFPAVDLAKSGTRRDDLLLTPDEQECVSTIRKSFIGSKAEEATDSVLDLFYKTRTNGEFVNMVKKHMWSF